MGERGEVDIKHWKHPVLKTVGWVICCLILVLPSLSLASEAKDRVKQIVKEARESVHEISAVELKEIMDAGQSFTLIDVREPGEYTAGRIEKSVLIPRGVLEWILPSKVKNTETPIVFYCEVGARSALTAKLSKELGYKNVKNLRGGFREWKKEGFQIVK